MSDLYGTHLTAWIPADSPATGEEIDELLDLLAETAIEFGARRGFDVHVSSVVVPAPTVGGQR